MEKKDPLGFVSEGFRSALCTFCKKVEAASKRGKSFPGKGKGMCAVGCRKLWGRAEKTAKSEIVQGSGRHRKVPLELPSLLLPLPASQPLARRKKEAPGLRTQLNVTAFAPLAGEAPDVTGRGLPEGRRC